MILGWSSAVSALRLWDVPGLALAVQPKLEAQDTSGKFALGEDKVK